MCDDWMPVLELSLTLTQFRQLPHNPAYKYEYLDGKARLSPRPKHYHAQLDLAGFRSEAAELSGATLIRPLQDECLSAEQDNRPRNAGAVAAGLPGRRR